MSRKLYVHYLSIAYMQKKEKDLIVRVQPSLFKKFKNKCEEDYKTVSEMIRELMKQYIDKKD